MKILVSDTSVLVDLERGGLLEAVFELPVELAVPDLLFERELRGHGGERLVELGLRVEELDADGVRRAIGYRRARRTLSLPDVFALELARRHGWILLTGDGALRALAGEQQVDCHGVLWVLDRMQDEAVVSVQALLDGLRRIEAHPRCRLPKRDMRIRLERYVAILSYARTSSRASRHRASPGPIALDRGALHLHHDLARAQGVWDLSPIAAAGMGAGALLCCPPL